MKRIVLHVKNTLPATYNRISLLPFKQSIVSKADYLVKMITLIKEIYPANLMYSNKELMYDGSVFKADLQDFENVFNDKFKLEFTSVAAQNLFDLFFNYINKNIPNLDYVNTMITKLQKQSDILIKRPDEINRISFIDALDNLDTVINTGENIEYIQNVKKSKDEILNYIYELVSSKQYIRVSTIKYDYPLVPTSGFPTSGIPTSGVPTSEVPTAENPALGIPKDGLPIPPNPTTIDEYAHFAAIILFNAILEIQKDKILPVKQLNKAINYYISKRNIIKDLKDYRIEIPKFTIYNTRASFLINMKNKIILELEKINEETYKDDTDMPSLEYMGDIGEAAAGTSDDAETITAPTVIPPTVKPPTVKPPTVKPPTVNKPILDLTGVTTKDEYVEAFVNYLLRLRTYYKNEKGIPVENITPLLLKEYDNYKEINHLEKLRSLLINVQGTSQNISNLIGGLYQSRLKKIPAGSGLRKTSKIQGTGFPQPAYNFTKQKVEPTQGIQSDPRYIKFGRYLVNTKSLKDNKLSLRREKGTPIASLPVYKMSHPFGNVMKKIVGGALPTAEDFSQLTDDEKRYLHKVSKEADLSHKMEIPTPSKDEEEKDVHLFNVYKGEIMAGNDSKEMIKKFKLLMIKLVNNRSLDKRDVSEIMQMLTEAGY